MRKLNMTGIIGLVAILLIASCVSAGPFDKGYASIIQQLKDMQGKDQTVAECGDIVGQQCVYDTQPWGYVIKGVCSRYSDAPAIRCALLSSKSKTTILSSQIIVTPVNNIPSLNNTPPVIANNTPPLNNTPGNGLPPPEDPDEPDPEPTRLCPNPDQPRIQHACVEKIFPDRISIGECTTRDFSMLLCEGETAHVICGPWTEASTLHWTRPCRMVLDGSPPPFSAPPPGCRNQTETACVERSLNGSCTRSQYFSMEWCDGRLVHLNCHAWNGQGTRTCEYSFE